MPLPLRSLEPYDRILTSPPCCKTCRRDAVLGLDTPTTVLTIRETSSMSKGELGKKDANGEIIMVEERAFYPIGPATQGVAHLQGNQNQELRGIGNPALDVNE